MPVEPPRLADEDTPRLLPPNSTVLETHVASMAAFDSIFVPVARTLSNIKANPPDSWIPWLLIENDLAQFSHYVSDQRQLLIDGYELNRIRGTAAAVEMICHWFDFPNAHVREATKRGPHFAEFEISLNKIPRDVSILCDLFDAINLVTPLRCRFRRVYYGLDIPKFVLGESDWGARLSDYSGVHVDDVSPCANKRNTALRASFRRSHWMLNEDGEPHSFFGEESVQSNFIRIHIISSISNRNPFPTLDVDWPHSFYDFRWYGQFGELAIETDTLTDSDGEVLVDYLDDPLLIIV